MAKLSSGLTLFISKVIDEECNPITVEHYGFATPNSDNMFHCLSALRAKFPAGDVKAERFDDGYGFRVIDYDDTQYIAVLASAADEHLAPHCSHPVGSRQYNMLRDGRKVPLANPRCRDCGAILERKN